MKLIAAAYTLDDISFYKDIPIDIIRFGEPDCFYRVIKNWPIENISKAIEIIQSSNKIPQFQFLNSPVNRDETNYLTKVIRTFPELTIKLETYGFINIKNKKIAGNGLKIFNRQSLKIIKKRNFEAFSVPSDFTPVEVNKFKKNLEEEKIQAGLEYYFYGHKELLYSWQCFLKKWESNPHLLEIECSHICNKQKFILTDSNNPKISFAVLGNTIVTANPENKIEQLKDYSDAGITQILLNFRFENREKIKIIVEEYVNRVKDQ